MGRVIGNLPGSPDGFVAGPNDGPGNPLDDGGERLFDEQGVTRLPFRVPRDG